MDNNIITETERLLSENETDPGTPAAGIQGNCTAEKHGTKSAERESSFRCCDKKLL